MKGGKSSKEKDIDLIHRRSKIQGRVMGKKAYGRELKGDDLFWRCERSERTPGHREEKDQKAEPLHKNEQGRV